MKEDIKVRLYPGTPSACAIVIEEIAKLKDLLEPIEIDTAIGKSTQQIQKLLYPELVKSGWILNFIYDSNTASLYPTSNYSLDAIKDVQSNSCIHNHRLLLELCFDNRQAIGTNLLKFETAKRIYERTDNSLATSIIVCGSQEGLADLKWDGGVASFSEYENALLTVYRDIFTIEPQYLIIKQ
ncbi:MAG: hypothetical protein F2954_05520 [Actinobacteria bacterium]|uniref:Unannotated protein n=1 Tax=freshwater metagenome TaxID=449393 RepID=A0A6J7VVJ7_9ZZZZ|nr:hypothetical protein [Actinomycetota bacterium]